MHSHNAHKTLSVIVPLGILIDTANPDIADPHLIFFLLVVALIALVGTYTHASYLRTCYSAIFQWESIYLCAKKHTVIFIIAVHALKVCTRKRHRCIHRSVIFVTFNLVIFHDFFTLSPQASRMIIWQHIIIRQTIVVYVSVCSLRGFIFPLHILRIAWIISTNYKSCDHGSWSRILKPAKCTICSIHSIVLFSAICVSKWHFIQTFYRDKSAVFICIDGHMTCLCHVVIQNWSRYGNRGLIPAILLQITAGQSYHRSSSYSIITPRSTRSTFIIRCKPARYAYIISLCEPAVSLAIIYIDYGIAYVLIVYISILVSSTVYEKIFKTISIQIGLFDLKHRIQLLLVSSDKIQKSIAICRILV